MIDRKTYLTLPGDYKTLKSDFLGALEASGKDVLVKSGQDSLYHFSPVCAH